MQNHKLIKVASILLILVLSVIILKYGKPFLVPLCFAGLFAMLLLPLCRWLEKRKIPKAIATALSILLLVGVIAGVVAFVSWQVSDLAQDASKIEQNVTEKYEQVRQYISTELGISREKQKALMERQQDSSGGTIELLKGAIGGLGTFLTNSLLVLVYIFVLLYFRAHLERFVVRLVPQPDEKKAVAVVHRIQRVTQQYLTGLSEMIAALWVMYGIAFTIVGVKNAIFFAVLCGLLEIIPFVGNLTGNVLTILMAISQGGGTHMIIGILVSYATIQFIQSYLLQPLVVGAEVDINPLFTIVGLIAGEFLWGIPGMVLAIPLMAIMKIVFDNIEALQPYGEVMGTQQNGESKITKKIKMLAKKILKIKG